MIRTHKSKCAYWAYREVTLGKFKVIKFTEA